MLIDPEQEQESVSPEVANHAYGDAMTSDNVVSEEEGLMPRPRKKGNQDSIQKVRINDSDNDEPFQTPLVLRHDKRPHRSVVINSESEESEDLAAQAAQQRLEEELAKYKQKETVKRKRDQMEEVAGGTSA